MERRNGWRRFLILLFFSITYWSGRPDHSRAVSASGEAELFQDPCRFPLPNPSGMEITKYRTLLYNFLKSGCYQAWAKDHEIRNTGPVIWNNHTNKIDNYGTHLAVRIYYSPQMWRWMKEP